MSAVSAVLVQGSGPGVFVVALMVGGTAVVVSVLAAFVFGGRYARPGASLSRAEAGELRRRAEAGISALAPGAILLSEKERGAGVAAGGPVSAEAAEFWRRYGGASGLVEEDPAAALGELEGLPDLLGRALEGTDRRGSRRAGSAQETEEDQR